MSCPDWRALAATREADPLDDPPGLSEAREHLADCLDCRQSAAAADPLLVFDRLRRPTGSRASSISASDPAMQESVMALVRASRVANATRERREPGISRRAGFGRVAAMLLTTVLLSLSGTPEPQATDLTTSGAESDAAAAQALSHWIEQAAELAQPAVEELDRPGARIYELPHADLAVVMIVDASLDV